MNLTPTEIEALWAILGKVMTALVALGGAIKTLQLLFSLTPTSKLEVRVTKCEQHLDKDLRRLENIDAKIEQLEEGQAGYKLELHLASKGINKIGTSQISLLRHMIDGNGIDEMRKEADDLTKFFIEQ